jgi:hypothetical protein
MSMGAERRLDPDQDFAGAEARLGQRQQDGEQDRKHSRY